MEHEELERHDDQDPVSDESLTRRTFLRGFASASAAAVLLGVSTGCSPEPEVLYGPAPDPQDDPGPGPNDDPGPAPVYGPEPAPEDDPEPADVYGPPPAPNSEITETPDP